MLRVGCHKILTSVGLKLVLGEKVRGEGTIDPGWGFLFGQRVYSLKLGHVVVWIKRGGGCSLCFTKLYQT